MTKPRCLWLCSFPAVLLCWVLLAQSGCGSEATPHAIPTIDSLTGIDTTHALLSDSARAASEGRILVPVRTASGWGFADTSGQVVVEARYDEVMPFSEGLAVVRRGDFYGMVDMQGNEVIRPEHARITPCACGVFTIETKQGVVIMNQQAKVVRKDGFDEIFGYTCSEGRIPVRKDGKIAFLDSTGQAITGFDYDQIFRFQNGFAPVLRLQEGGPMGWGLIDRSGKLVVDHQYRKLFPFVNGRGVASQVDAQGEEKWGLIDTTGKVLIPFEFDYIAGTASGSHIIARANGADPEGKEDFYYVFDRNGKHKWNTEYRLWDEFSEGLVVMEEQGRFGFVDTTGVVLIPPVYEWACAFSEGMAWAVKDGLGGFIGHDGEPVIPFQYAATVDYVTMEPHGVEVKDPKTGERFFVDPSGREYRQ